MSFWQYVEQDRVDIIRLLFVPHAELSMIAACRSYHSMEVVVIFQKVKLEYSETQVREPLAGLKEVIYNHNQNFAFQR
jgi:hypothetical protein